MKFKNQSEGWMDCIMDLNYKVLLIYTWPNRLTPGKDTVIREASKCLGMQESQIRMSHYLVEYAHD